MQDLGSVLPDWNFVQTRAISSSKFNVSVAAGLQSGQFRGPKVEQQAAVAISHANFGKAIGASNFMIPVPLSI